MIVASGVATWCENRSESGADVSTRRAARWPLPGEDGEVFMCGRSAAERPAGAGRRRRLDRQYRDADRARSKSQRGGP